ncbi:hypothetical protein J7438_12095 [Thalassotalea sp. G20_0]|uniref:hypothetical protein n=1 Tax=Thalassotalea sp. G20_0 TaxID=2821093 RepID=UPI001AD9AA40|nr:hypothetical protein [Thalassotalea sp. G20_0]MBO9494817.1 hypothetical protein [Thalassotalea sp. G20_0]
MYSLLRLLTLCNIGIIPVAIPLAVMRIYRGHYQKAREYVHQELIVVFQEALRRLHRKVLEFQYQIHAMNEKSEDSVGVCLTEDGKKSKKCTGAEQTLPDRLRVVPW